MAILKNTTIDDTGFLQIPSGTTAQRPDPAVLGDFRYNTEEEAFEVYNGEEWVDLGTVSSGLYNFTTATFSPGGATGSFGPSLTQARTGLTGPGVDAWKNNTEFFNTTNGIQLWTVPANGTYRIEAWGAQGQGTQPGLGARMRGDFELTKGEIIRIMVGQQPSGSAGDNAGGGGGSFVVRTPYDTNDSILVIAGGGAGSLSTAINRHGNTSTSGSNGVNGVVSVGGTGGNGGAVGNSNQGPGGGFFTDGAGTANNRGRAFINGGDGGSDTISGGFGGGGGTISSAAQRMGGGGGYSGGGVARSDASATGGGGGSFNSGTNQSNSAGVRTGNGQVTITLL